LCSSSVEAVRGDGNRAVDDLKHRSKSELATELSFHLAALQLYAYALEGHPGLPTTRATGSMHSSNESTEDGLVDVHAIHEVAMAAMKRSDTLVAVLQANQPSKQAVLPNPWHACYHAALKWAEEAATEEILGNYQRGEELYARAGAVLHFLGAETASLPNHVLLFYSSTIGKDERQMKQLRRCAAAIAVRWAICAALSVSNRQLLL
jgi:hypothetical protein